MKKLIDEPILISKNPNETEELEEVNIDGNSKNEENNCEKGNNDNISPLNNDNNENQNNENKEKNG